MIRKFLTVLVSPNDDLPELTQMYSFYFYFIVPLRSCRQGSLPNKSGWRTSSPHSGQRSCGAHHVAIPSLLPHRCAPAPCVQSRAR